MFNAYITSAANELTEQIRQLSPAAADCVERVRAKYGDCAAYLAAFALVVEQESFIQSSHFWARKDFIRFTFYEEMRNTPAAIQLYEEAAAHLLRSVDRGDGVSGQQGYAPIG